tara:strand:- start:238 stop:597 length:360 start_codon:yes stop_codon:yes gene_type:complete
MLTEIKDVFPKAKAQAALEDGGRNKVILAKFIGDDASQLTQLFERYYPAARDLNIIDVQLHTQAQLDELVKRVPNLAGAQDDHLGMGPIVADGPPGAGSAGVQASVVDEVYARVSALRL